MNIIIYSCMVAFTLILSSAQFILGVVDGLMEDSFYVHLGVHRRPCLLCVYLQLVLLSIYAVGYYLLYWSSGMISISNLLKSWIVTLACRFTFLLQQYLRTWSPLHRAENFDSKVAILTPYSFPCQVTGRDHLVMHCWTSRWETGKSLWGSWYRRRMLGSLLL